MRLDESTSLRERLLGWTSRLGRARTAEPGTGTQTEKTSREPSNRKSHSPNLTTFQNTLNEWVSESRQVTNLRLESVREPAGRTAAGIDYLTGGPGRAQASGWNFLERWLGQDPVRKKQTEIGQARTELRHVDVSLQDLNRRIEHLEQIAEKWQTHTPRKNEDSGSQFNHQV